MGGRICSQNKFDGRQSNIELLRSITMIVIIAHHYVVNSGIDTSVNCSLTSNYIFARLFGWGGKTGINVFALITGYFACKSELNLKRYFKLIFEVEFYNISIFCIMHFMGYQEISIKAIETKLIPLYEVGNEFVASYLVFYFLMPFLKLFVENLGKKNHEKLIIICILINTIPQTFLFVPNAFTYVGLFCFFYLISSYIRYVFDKDYVLDNSNIIYKYYDKYVWVCSIGMVLVSWISVLMEIVVYRTTGKYLWYHFVSDSNKLLAVLTAVFVFIAFLKLNVRNSRLINSAGKSCFGVLLIHANSDAMRTWLWKDTLNNAKVFQSSFLRFATHAILSTISIFIICVLIDYVRRCTIERWFDELLDTIPWVNRNII